MSREKRRDMAEISEVVKSALWEPTTGDLAERIERELVERGLYGEMKAERGEPERCGGCGGLKRERDHERNSDKICRCGGRKRRLLSYLDAGVERILDGEEFKRYLAFAAKFYRYSANNSLLILLQRPDATKIAGYKRWQQPGRQVQRGEEGIRILAPIIWTVEDEESGEKARMLCSFKVVKVFDVSQTDPVPGGTAHPREAAARSASRLFLGHACAGAVAGAVLRGGGDRVARERRGARRSISWRQRPLLAKEVDPPARDPL